MVSAGSLVLAGKLARTESECAVQADTLTGNEQWQWRGERDAAGERAA